MTYCKLYKKFSGFQRKTTTYNNYKKYIFFALCWLIFRSWAALLEGKGKNGCEIILEIPSFLKEILLWKETNSIIGTTLGSAHPDHGEKVTIAVYTHRRVLQTGSEILFSIRGQHVCTVTNERSQAFEVSAPPVSARRDVMRVLICTFQTGGPCQNGWVLLATSCKYSHKYSVETCGWERHKQVL